MMLNFFAQYPILSAILALLVMALIFGGILGFAAEYFKVEGDPLVDQINAVLPQTQCGQCGYPGCRPYATAIADGDDINKCPPGGENTIQELAILLDVEPMPLDESHGVEKPRTVAYIHEEQCIGCMLCIKACPVDAILGSAKHMHTVIADECTGCDLCVEPCPVDCIDMIEIKISPQSWKWDLPIPPHDLIATDSNRPLSNHGEEKVSV